MDPIHTRIAASDTSSITVRGKDLVDDLIGERGFTETLYFLICHRFPTAGETRILDACLVTLMEHGFTPSSIIARLMIDSVPDEMQVAVAGGLLSIGSVFAGTMEGCARLIQAADGHSDDLAAFCENIVATHRATKTTLPGFGHPIHKPDDPRTPKLFAVAEKNGASGRYIALLKQMSAQFDRLYGRHLTINATGGMAALLLEIGFPPDAMRGISVVSRAGGLIGHVQEERETKSARRIWKLVEENIPYQRD